MNGRRSKLMRAHCDYNIQDERQKGRRYTTQYGHRECTGFRDDYRVFKRSIILRKQFSNVAQSVKRSMKLEKRIRKYIQKYKTKHLRRLKSNDLTSTHI